MVRLIVTISKKPVTNAKEQAELINQYKMLIENPKTPHRESIEKAIELAEMRIKRGVKVNN